MAKESGIGLTVTVDDSGGTGQAITNDITNVSWQMPSAVQDVTGLDKAGHERLLLLADFSITMNGVFNDAANKSHAVLKNYRTLAANQVGRTVAIAHSGQSLSVEVLIANYDWNRGADGSAVWQSGGSLADGNVPLWS
jgi:hypothetical protein